MFKLFNKRGVAFGMTLCLSVILGSYIFKQLNIDSEHKSADMKSKDNDEIVYVSREVYEKVMEE